MMLDADILDRRWTWGLPSKLAFKMILRQALRLYSEKCCLKSSTKQTIERDRSSSAQSDTTEQLN